MPIFAPFSFSQYFFDINAIEFINAAEITDTTQQTAINNLVLDLKSAGIWSKMKAVYPFVGGTAEKHKWNLINPQNTNAAFRLTYSGTITHNSNGIQGNGSNGFFNTYLNPSTQLSLNNSSAFMYIRTNVQGSVLDFGVLRSSPSPEIGFHYNARNNSNQMSCRVHGENPTSAFPSSTSSIAFRGISRTSSSEFIASINKSKTTLASNSVALINANMFGLAGNRDGSAANFSSRQYALFAVGEGLTSSQTDDFVDINERFQTTLGRFV